MDRLDQLRCWKKGDPDLFHSIDITLDNRIKAAEQRQQEQDSAAALPQRSYAIIATNVALIVGRLLSLVGTPTTLAHAFGH
jgi:hypothetical protein